MQNHSKAGHSTIIDSCGNLFKAVAASTSAVDARANTDTEATDTDAAIYWLNGAKAADNYTAPSVPILLDTQMSKSATLETAR